MAFNDSSIDALRQAVRLSPENVPLRRHLGEILAQAQRWGEAELELREALRLDPEHTEAKIDLARVLHRQKRSSEALFLLRQIGSPADELQGRSSRLAAEVLLDLGQLERTRWGRSGPTCGRARCARSSISSSPSSTASAARTGAC